MGEQFCRVVGISIGHTTTRLALFNEASRKPVVVDSTVVVVSPRFANPGSKIAIDRIKQTAERAVGGRVNGAILTVPTGFDAGQVEVVKALVEKAGMRVHQVVCRAEAAVIEQRAEEGMTGKATYLVFHLGGKSCEAAVVRAEGEWVLLLTSSSRMDLGGQDFDRITTDWARNQRSQYFGSVAAETQEEGINLAREIEEARIRLTSQDWTEVELEQRSATSLRLTRAVFENLTGELADETMQQVQQALAAAEAQYAIGPEDITSVLLTGGSSRMPVIQRRLEQLFSKYTREISGERPENMAALGAARLASRVEEPADEPIRRRTEIEYELSESPNFYLSNITSQAYGIGVSGDDLEIIARESWIPVERTCRMYAKPDASGQLRLSIWAGGEGGKMVVGAIDIGTVENKVTENEGLDISMTLDSHGVLTTTVRHLESNWTISTTIDVGDAAREAARQEKALRKVIKEALMAEHTQRMVEAVELWKKAQGMTNHQGEVNESLHEIQIYMRVHQLTNQVQVAEQAQDFEEALRVWQLIAKELPEYPETAQVELNKYLPERIEQIKAVLTAIKQLTLAYPKRLSKRYTSTILVYFHPKNFTARVKTRLKKQLKEVGKAPEAYETRTQTTQVAAGETVQVKIDCPGIEFSSPTTVRVNDEITQLIFLARPTDGCQVGSHMAKLAVCRAGSGVELFASVFEIRVVDFVIDHISRPLALKSVSVISGLGAAVMYLLTLFGQIDTTIGLASGTTIGVFSLAVYTQFNLWFQQMRHVSITS
ncbi:MAG: Hsp70 family protein [Chloroflexota bacterium]